MIPRLSGYENLAYHNRSVEVFDALDMTRESFWPLSALLLTSQHIPPHSPAFLSCVTLVLAFFGFSALKTPSESDVFFKKMPPEGGAFTLSEGAYSKRRFFEEMPPE